MWIFHKGAIEERKAPKGTLSHLEFHIGLAKALTFSWRRRATSKSIYKLAQSPSCMYHNKNYKGNVHIVSKGQIDYVILVVECIYV
jgi:hypothetical protein